MDLPPYKLITTESGWHSCLAKLRQEPRIAIDLEANSLYAYREQVCLIQISIPEQDYIIDPLARLDLSELGVLLRDPAIEKVLHAAEYDLILVKRQFGWKCNNLFDTMWATRILGYERCGLANILESSYGVQLNKRHQKANWCKRPLTAAQLSYARMDTHYLLRLRDNLTAELDAAGRTAEALEIFNEQTHIRINNNEFRPDSFWSISGVNRLTPAQQAIVKALHIYRDQQAKKQDRPPFKVFDNRTIIELAKEAPQYLDQLPTIHGMSRGQIRRYGRQMLRIIREAQSGPLPQKPRRNNNRPSEIVTYRYEKLHAWRKRRAQERGVESDVIISREALWALARAHPKSHTDLAEIQALGSWKQETYGDEILRLLKNTR